MSKVDNFTDDVYLGSNTPKEWWIRCVAKLDTGANRTSIDTKLCNFLRLEKCGTTKVTNAMGSQRRKLVWLTLIWNDEVFRVKASVTDREHLSTPIILGQDILSSTEQ